MQKQMQKQKQQQAQQQLRMQQQIQMRMRQPAKIYFLRQSGPAVVPLFTRQTADKRPRCGALSQTRAREGRSGRAG